MINLRGTVLPIIDMATRLGLPDEGPVARQVIIVVWIGERLAGLLVDAVSDILGVPEEAFQAMPEISGDAGAALVSRLLTIDERLMGQIAPDQLLPEVGEAA